MTDEQADRERLIRELMARRGMAPAARPGGVPRRPAGCRVPLSPMQQGMWFLDRLQPGSAAYVLAEALRVTGEVDPTALRAAVDGVVARQEALRTVFVERDGAVEQVVLPVADPRLRGCLTVRDLTDVGSGSVDRSDTAVDVLTANADRLDAAVAEVTRRECGTGFDLGRAPLLRVCLARLGPDEHLLVVAMHHIIADERSLALVVGEILDGHHRHGAGGPAPAEPAVQFPDLVVWKHERMTGDDVTRQRAFWTERLAGCSGILDLPTDRPRPATQTFAGATRPVTFSGKLAGAVDALARRTGCTRFMVYLAATQVLLGRLSGSDDICVGSPVTLRSGDQQQEIVGLLVNSVPLRTDLSGDPTLTEVLHRVQQTCVASLGHAELPFEQVVELAGLPRDLSRNPLFQVMLVVNQAGGEHRRAGLLLRPWPISRETARLDLTLAVQEHADGLGGLIDYNTDLFDEVTVDRIAERWQVVLRVLTTEPDRRLSTLDLVGPADRRDLARWNDTDRSYPTGVALHELISARAAAAPHAPAVLDASPDATGTPMLTYGQLDRRSDLLAARLRDLGVRCDQPVGLVLPAGIAAVTGIVAVLKASGGYLPLDPTHPPVRLRALLADAGVTVTVTDAAHADSLADSPSAVVVVDADGRADGPPATGTGPVRPHHPDQLAYLIYTSGSTGTPKAVMVGHRTAVNLAHTFADLHGITAGDRLLMLPPLSFDASVGDLFPALVSGATLVLHRDPAALTGPGLLELCRRHRISLVDTAAPLWIRWVDDLAGTPGVRSGDEPVAPRSGRAGPGPLRAMMVGGEAVPLPVVRDWARLTDGQVTLHNHYGPTEATVCATTYATVDGSELPGLTRLPIGRPVPNVRVHLLDADLRPVPVGLPAQVYVGGTAPARGYLGAPGLTADRFVPDPYAKDPGGRLYATGDLARHRADGTLEFLGRTDRQVKIRGHRIEIGEVESACTAVPGVRRAAVVVAGGTAGPRLVAYLVTDDDGLDIPAVRAALRQRMPEYLVPSAFVMIGELPTNRHGKLDLAALPPALAETDQPVHVPPGTPTEQALAGIWADLLGIGPIGVRDNFFDRGGHSLLAAPFVARVRATLGVDVPLRALFDTPDLAGLAASVDGLTVGSGVGGVPAVHPDLLRVEARLADDLRIPSGSPPAVPETVLFTGATGFLGAYLLADWLDNGPATVHCLVRATSPAAAVDRVRENLHRYGLWRDRYAGRLVGVPGDLGAPRLGLSGDGFAALGARLDAIVHNGGVVNFLHPYPVLRPANVGGTLEMLRLACAGRSSAVHFVSTLGVFLTPARLGTVVHEGDPPDDCVGLGDGYNSTKWVADALVRAARQRGLPVSVHRPARITGDAATGVGNSDDYFSRLLRTCVQLGGVPDLADALDLAPVDHVAAGIGRLSRAGSVGDHHYYNNRTLSFAGLAEALAAFGYPVDLVPYPTWRAALLDRPDAALAGFAPLFGPATPVRTQPDFDCTPTETALASAGITCPAADRRLLHTYLSAFVRAGFLDPPPSGSVHG